MASVINSVFHNSIAESVVAEILANTARYYYYFGNSLPLLDPPETPLDSPQYIAHTRASMILLSQITAGDVSFVVPRVDWTGNTRYNKYDSLVTGTPTNFYVITTDFNVYKCLDNSVDGALSTVKPTGTATDPFVTGDGYKWKFMYNVPLSLRNKFMTVAYIPVSTGLKNRFYSAGEIDSLTIVSHGTGYVQASTSITVTGDGTGAGLSPIISSGKLVGITIDTPGIGYTYATITVVSPVVTLDANKAVVVANLDNGNITSQQAIIENLTTPGTIDSATVVNGGGGFTGVPTVIITGDGTGCTATATIANGSITHINIVNPGSGYTFANVTLSNVIGGTGYSLSANVSPPFGHGRNAIKELYANTLMFYGNLSGSTVDNFSVNNEYDQFGLVKNMRNTAYDLEIADVGQKGKVIIYVTDAISLFTIGTQIRNTGLSQTYTVSATQVGGTQNALELVPSGAYTPVIGTVYTLVGGSATVTPLALKNKAMVGTRTATMCYIVTATFNPSIWVAGSTVTKGSNTFSIISVLPTQLLIQALDGGVINTGDVLTLGVNTLTVSNSAPPDADKNTGDVLTIDNRPAFLRSAEQSVSTRTVIRF